MRPAFRSCVTSTVRSPCQYQPTRPSIPLATKSKRHRSDNTTTRPKQTFEGYIADKLDAPLYSITPQTRTQPASPPPDELPKTAKEETLAKARVVFGSRLAGPIERREQIEKLSTNIGGVMVPPKPEEPDNCCMSGCVNCVWDRYRDELEEWAEASAKARSALQAKKGASMDEDGGGSDMMWDPLGAGGDLLEGIPVGIREFMKTEKKLKEKKERKAREIGQSVKAG